MNGEAVQTKSVGAPVGGAIVDPARQSILLAALYIAQEQQGYLTKDAIARVAKRLGDAATLDALIRDGLKEMAR